MKVVFFFVSSARGFTMSLKFAVHFLKQEANPIMCLVSIRSLGEGHKSKIISTVSFNGNMPSSETKYPKYCKYLLTNAYLESSIYKPASLMF